MQTIIKNLFFAHITTVLLMLRLQKEPKLGVGVGVDCLNQQFDLYAMCKTAMRAAAREESENSAIARAAPSLRQVESGRSSAQFHMQWPQAIYRYFLYTHVPDMLTKRDFKSVYHVRTSCISCYFLGAFGFGCPVGSQASSKPAPCEWTYTRSQTLPIAKANTRQYAGFS
eukprot:5130152-Amphidinium_carterae.1